MSDTDLVLEANCDECKSEGFVRDCGRWETCISCGGAGYTRTKLGERVLALMRHNFRVLLREMAEGILPQ